MVSPKDDPRRRWRGQKVHYDEQWNFSFYVPLHWKQYDLTDEYGVLYAPADDPRTCFFCSVRDLSDELEEPLTEADLPALREGALAGLKNLPDCQILHDREIAKESAFGLEIVLTFTLDGETCKRRAFLLYRDRQQLTIYGQGCPEREYEVFYDMLGFMYTSFTFSDLRTLVKPPPGPPIPPGALGGLPPR